MSNQNFDPAQLNESQQLALGTYTSVTNQEPSAAVPLLQRSEWNVQVRPALYILPRDYNSRPAADEAIRSLSPSSSMAKPQTQSPKLALLCHRPLLHLSP